MQIYLLILLILGVSAIIGCSTAGGGGPDTTAPTVASTSPVNATMGAAMDGTITATFSKAMNPATIVTANFTVAQGLTPVPGAVTYDAATKSGRFVPTSYLSGNLVYTATIKTGVKDVAGNALAANMVWTFTTALGPSPVPLHTAANYVILGNAPITNHATSVITGDVAINMTSATLLGFGLALAVDHWVSTQVAGTLYSTTDLPAPATATIGQAALDMAAAYTNASTRPAPLPANVNINNGVATQIGGVAAFTPGLYVWGSAVNIGAGGITISGAANDVWIFQMSGVLNLANGINITLTGGAQAKNVYWAVGGATNLGTSSNFKGILLGVGAVTLFNGASVNGRVLSIGALDMTSSTVTKP